MSYLLSLRDDVTLTERGPEELQLQLPGRPVVMLAFRQVTPALREIFAQLQDGGAAADEAGAAVMIAEGPQGLFKLNHFIKTMDEARLLCRTVLVGDEAAARLTPLSDRFVFRPDAVSTAVQLSRFALLRRDGARLVIESPLGLARLELLSERVTAAIAALGAPVTSALFAARTGWPAEDASALLTLLANAGALTVVDDGGAAEDRDEALMQWEFHDLYFHSRSRLGRHASPFGGVFRFDGRVPPLPALKPAMSATPIALPVPDIEHLKTDDPPFTAVVERRRSLRDQNAVPLSIEQLAEFLYRSVRVREIVPTEHGELSFRVNPAGGAIHETEIYAVVDRVTGLESGLYHYDPSAHALEPVAGRTGAVTALLDAAYFTADQKSRPQVLLVITARFQRLQWKYQSMAYAATLKHVGVIYQTMYLVATAMDLAPCALGGGHSDLFADAAGLNYYAETSVGEFILGTRATIVGPPPVTPQ